MYFTDLLFSRLCYFTLVVESYIGEVSFTAVGFKKNGNHLEIKKNPDKTKLKNYHVTGLAGAGRGACGVRAGTEKYLPLPFYYFLSLVSPIFYFLAAPKNC